jgi:hypothetical protein
MRLALIRPLRRRLPCVTAASGPVPFRSAFQFDPANGIPAAQEWENGPCPNERREALSS